MGNRVLECVRGNPDEGISSGGVLPEFEKALAAENFSCSTSASNSASLPPSFIEKEPESSSKQVLRPQQCVGVLRHCERADLTWDSFSPTASPTQKMKWRHDPTLSDSGREHAADIGRDLAAKSLKFDAVVSSPYRRCMETAVRICVELQVPLAIDERLGEVQNTSVMGDTPPHGRFHRNLADNIRFAKAHGVEVIGLEDLCGTTSPNDLPQWEESIQKAFTRYAKAFEFFVTSGKSIFCVTHGMGLVSVTNKFCDDYQTTNPSMGDFFVCDVSNPTAVSTRNRHKYRVITHSAANRCESAMKSHFKRSTSCPAVDSLASLAHTRRPSIQLPAVQESNSSNELSSLPHERPLTTAPQRPLSERRPAPLSNSSNELSSLPHERPAARRPLSERRPAPLRLPQKRRSLE